MNNKIIISLIVIAVLLAYLFIDKGRKSDLPEIEKWEGRADSIQITKGDSKIRIFVKDNRWVINDEEYPADKKEISKLEKKLKELLITDLISKKPHYARYELTPEKAIRVIVEKDGTVLRDILIGKKSSTFRHAYIRFYGTPEIYLVQGGLTDDFKRGIEELREKEIIKIAKNGIKSFELTYKGKKITIEKVVEKKEESGTEGKEKDKKKEKKAEKREKWICKEFRNIEIDKKRVNSIINSFNPLRADSFPEYDKGSLRGYICRVNIKAYNKSISVTVFKKEKKGQNKYICTSSESPYVFTLSEWKVKKYFKGINDLKKK